MTTLFDLSLSLARKVTHVQDGTATAGDARSLIDSEAEFGIGSLAGGTLWILGGTHAGKSRIVRTNPKDKLTFANLGSVLCVQQVETATVVGTVSGNGNAAVVITAAGMANSPKTLSVAVVSPDTASQVATKIRTALKADVDVNEFFAISGTGAAVILTARSAAANDTTMNMSIDNGTCSGLTAAPTSTHTTAGVAGPAYAVADDEFSRTMLWAAINEGLRKLAPRVAEDVSLVTVALQEEYTLPAGVSELLMVEIATTAVTPFGFELSYHWDPVDGKLRFPRKWVPASSGYPIRLTYRTAFVTLGLDADKLSFGVNEETLYWQALVALMSDAMKLRPKEKRYADVMNEAQEMLRRTRPNQQQPTRTPRLADW